MSDNTQYDITRIICLCCLSRNRLIKLDKCKHGLFFTKIFENKVNIAEMYVCTFCHEFIKKIDNFTRQVEQSVITLNQKYEEFHNEQKMLELSATEINYAVNNDILKHEIVPNLSLTVDMKPEVKMDETTDTEDELNDYQMTMSSKDDLKIKIEITNIKVDSNETQNVIENKKPKLEKDKDSECANKKFGITLKDIDFELKINIVTITLEQLLEERKRESMDKKYLKKHFKCDACITGFMFKSKFESHMKQRHHLREGSVICDICKCCCKNVHALKVHERRHFVRYECRECGVLKPSRDSAVSHYETNHNDVPLTYNCKLCSFTTDTYKKLISHSNRHKERFPCELCDRAFRTQSSLNTHISFIHSGPWSCKVCDKKFKSKLRLKTHESTHEKREPTADTYCESCHKFYGSPRMLEIHYRTHSKHIKESDKRFSCNECGVRFVYKSELKSHIEWKHLNNMKDVCKICNKVFRSKKTLKIHKKYVHDKVVQPKRHVCDHCGKAFAVKGTLKSHIRTHTGERPFKCQLCDKTFGFKAALYTHNRLVHKKRTKSQ